MRRAAAIAALPRAWGNDVGLSDTKMTAVTGGEIDVALKRANGFAASSMKLARRQFLHLAAAAASLPAACRIARAQAYPTRPVRLIVGFAAGSTSDILGRLMTSPESISVATWCSNDCLLMLAWQTMDHRNGV